MHEIQMLGLLDHDVLSSIEVPYLPEQYASLLDPAHEGNFEAFVAAKREADKFDTDIFEFKDPEVQALSSNRTSGVSITGATPVPSAIRVVDKRATAQHRTSQPPSKIHRIEESPHPPEEEPLPIPGFEKRLLVTSLSSTSTSDLSTSPSQASIHTTRSDASTSSTQGNQSNSASLLRSKFAPSWLFNPFRSGPSQAETSPVSASGESTPIRRAHRPSKALLPTPLTPIDRKVPAPSPQPHARSPLTMTTDMSSSPRPMPIKGVTSSRRSRAFEDGGLLGHGSFTKHSQSPMNTPPRDDTLFERRRSVVPGNSAYLLASSPSVRQTPSGPQIPVSYTDSSLARRWQHMFPRPVFKHDIKWKSMVTPGCLALTTEEFPSTSELETSYDVFSYDFVVDPPETRSFLVRPPATAQSQNPDEVRRLWALVVMRGMIALRLAQGFQIVLRPANSPDYDPDPDPRALRRTKSYVSDEDATPRPIGAAEALRAQADPVYLSMSNEIHRIAYTGEAIQVRRYVRRMPPTPPLRYKCLIWPKLGIGYTELSLSFAYHGLENYGWNR